MPRSSPESFQSRAKDEDPQIHRVRCWMFVDTFSEIQELLDLEVSFDREAMARKQQAREAEAAEQAEARARELRAQELKAQEQLEAELLEAEAAARKEEEEEERRAEVGC